MQLYALDAKENLISSLQASKQTNYNCLECRRAVRLRAGPHRQRHFYHLDPSPACRQHRKGPVHLQLQAYFANQLPLGDCCLEYRLDAINRIADVAWLSKKIVFEIQYSAISAQEVLERNQDYQQAGWTVIWILHDHLYNQDRLSAMEMALNSSPHFFSNFNAQGEGIIYDQFDIRASGFRKVRFPPLMIAIDQIHAFSKNENIPSLNILIERTKHWPYLFEGDLMSLFLTQPSSPYLKKASDAEASYFHKNLLISRILKDFWRRLCAPYKILFRFLLERACRY